jgi:hypothetical protein
VWGGGVLPDRVVSDARRAYSDDDLLQALIHTAGGVAQPLSNDFSSTSLGQDDVALCDLRRCRDLAALQRDWLLPAVRAVRAGALKSLVLDAADGSRLQLASGQRWRFWRSAWSISVAKHSQADDSR